MAEDVVATAPIPATARALRDGWAVRADLTTDAGTYAPAPLPSAVRVDVGQPLAGDADAVAPLDAVTVRNGAAQALAPVGPGDGVLAAGADAAPRDHAAASGPSLCSVCRSRCWPRRVSRPCAFARRDCAWCAPGRSGDAFIDAAFACVADAIGSHGRRRRHRRAGRPRQARWRDAAVDAVVVVGGTGSGRNDATVHTLASVGEVHVHGIALLPGETTAFGAVGSRPVLALPGRLDAALAAWHLLGQAMLARLAGSREPPRLRTAKLTHKVSSAVGLVGTRAGALRGCGSPLP